MAIINSVIAGSGGGTQTKYGLTIDNLIGSVDANGVFKQQTAPSGDIVFTGVKDIASYALSHKFFRLSGFSNISISFPDLENITGNYALDNMCYYTNIKSISFPKLKTISAASAAYYSFCGTNIVSADFPELKTVSGASSFSGAIGFCTSLETVSFPELEEARGVNCFQYLVANTKVSTISFPKLNNIDGNSIFVYAFYTTQLLSSINFPALTTTSFGSYTNQFQNMFNSSTASTSGSCTVHFPSNLQSTISGLTGYPTFGGDSSRIVLAFDLPQTS